MTEPPHGPHPEALPAPSLAARVLGAVLVILLLGGVLVAGSTWWNGRLAARQSYDRLLLGAARDIAESIRIQDGAPLVDLPVSAFELLAQAPEDRVYYAVTGPGGRFITGLDATLKIPAPPRGAAGTAFFEAPLNGEPARFVRITRRFVERNFSGPVEVVVGQTQRARRAMTGQLVLDAMLPMLAAGIALLMMSWVVVRRALRPLEALTGDLARRDPYDLTPMPADGLPRELQVMLGAMNRFMGRLDAQVSAMRTLISDTAHQLRTPVAAIRVQAEMALSDPGEQARGRALERLLARTRSLGTLLDQLLSRALVIHRTDSAQRTAVDLRETALEIMEREDHLLLAPGSELRLEIGEDPVIVRADAFSLGEAARNLLSNALRHGQAPVRLGAERRGDKALLWVQDSGPGPDPAVVARWGQRFNRSAGSSEDSAGIGLSIVSAVARAFGGRVETRADADGFRVALVLPAVDPPEKEPPA
ncbi:sensor histidine kinase N-terminal domain-containing protein [Pseudooceanicola sp. CBS1P-1]|uniref:histidine kinase n=1 Tax=Pseudooceanicola albus TaxID=2692189 RepID=A0A6L7FZD0_9RHOB|nr:MULTISPECIES: sensor histidine kinase [Pseudooceanicola]MBT9383599.1 sensor histidine kinase N-terminal domain-containing protein [Pseudooceanicola endophyticus]MXN17454.1 sensor histidine kinase [Pseudooceanicola albus]